MKRLYLLVYMIIGFIVASGQQIITLSNGITTAGIYLQAPTRNIEYVSNGIVVTYNFEKATIMEDPLYQGCYMWNYMGFGVNDVPTQPAIPYRLDSFAIPEGCVASVEVIDSQYVDLSYVISPARPPLIDSSDDEYTIDNIPAISAFDGFYPSCAVSIDGINIYRGTNIANIIISPLQYNYVDSVIRAFTCISYKVSFIEQINTLSHEITNNYIDQNDAYLSNVTLNVIPSELESNGELTPPLKSYLILSTPTFETAVEKIADWKRLLGYNVRTILNNSWTVDSIKSTIQNYKNENNSLYYLLIVGDMEDVPSQISYTYYNSYQQVSHVTDFYYACLDGIDDTTPDLLYGRIPVKTSSEANIVIDKIIGYEKNPTIDTAFYKTGLHCAQFQDENFDKYEDRRFTLTSEEVRNSMIAGGYNVNRVYKANNNVEPLYWGRIPYSFGDSIPIELQKPNFSWSGDSTDIKASVSNGSFYILHRDHGSVSGWGTPSFKISNIKSLNNCDKLPVVFSINCKTGMFNNSADCFCEVFLKKENGGCIAIYGATHNSLSGYNDALSEGMFDAIWPSEKLRPRFPNVSGTGGITPTPTYELGQILNQGKTRLAETYGIKSSNNTKYTNELFHCFGDPSMKIYTDVPTPFANVEITRTNDSVFVNLNGDTATIVFQNQLTGETLCAAGTSAILPVNPSTKIKICISSHNKIPYICDVEPYMVYFQNENVIGPANYNADNIKAGTHVTDSKPEGPVVFDSGHIVLKAKRILFEGATTVNKGAKLELINKNN